MQSNQGAGSMVTEIIGSLSVIAIIGVVYKLASRWCETFRVEIAVTGRFGKPDADPQPLPRARAKTHRKPPS